MAAQILTSLRYSRETSSLRRASRLGVLFSGWPIRAVFGAANQDLPGQNSNGGRGRSEESASGGVVSVVALLPAGGQGLAAIWPGCHVAARPWDAGALALHLSPGFSSSMDVTGSFFDKLRTLAVALEKQTEQLKLIFHSRDTELEDDSPMRYLHDLYSEVGALKVDADNTLSKSSLERDATYDFIKATKVLMRRNATEIGKISDVFQKYGYKPFGMNTVMKDEAENNPESVMSDQEKLKNLACPENPSGLHSPLQLPQLSDFGLSKYALPSTLNTVHLQHQGCVQKEEPKVDDSEYLSPKTEHFHIHGRDLCLNDNTTNLMEDQTIFLLNAKNNRQTNKLSGAAAVLTPKENLATPSQKNKLYDYDCMASPVAPVFRTPGLKIPSRKNLTLPNSPEVNQSDASKPTTETFQDMQSLKVELKQITDRVPNNYPIRSSAASIQGWDKALENLEEPSPPTISDYTSLLGSPPPPPQITAIPTQILQILSKYNPNFDRGPLIGVGNKENREYTG